MNNNLLPENFREIVAKIECLKEILGKDTNPQDGLDQLSELVNTLTYSWDIGINLIFLLATGTMEEKDKVALEGFITVLAKLAKFSIIIESSQLFLERLSTAISHEEDN